MQLDHLPRRARSLAAACLLGLAAGPGIAAPAAEAPAAEAPAAEAAAAEAVTDGDYVTRIENFRAAIDFRFRDRILSPLPDAQRRAFPGLAYFPIDPSMALAASLDAQSGGAPVALPTFDGGVLAYRRHGTIHARLAGRDVSLRVFRREPEPGRRDFLLVPFRDPTNGTQTYAGGRYIELDLPVGDRLLLDFNKAMNPLCAYDSRYACPVPPAENQLSTPIRAGEKRYR